jgi:ribose transport system substrate-binding protein
MKFTSPARRRRRASLPPIHTIAAAVACVAMLAACGTIDDKAEADDPKKDGQGTTEPISAVGTVDDLLSLGDMCGDEDITIAYVDSYAGVNSWRKITQAELMDEAAKCPNVEIITTDGQGSLQKTISDVQGVVAQDVDAIVLQAADFGKGLLPAARAAEQAGIPVSILLGAGIGGAAGTDYSANVYADEIADAKLRVAWLAKVMGGSGNIVHLGGTPGNPLSAAVNDGIKEQLKTDTGLTLLEPDPIDTNFDPAVEQKAVAGLLTKYDDINGVQNECGTCAPGGFRAFGSAGRPLVPWVSDDNNEVACAYYALKDANPDFEIMTTGARTWLARVALHFAVAAAEGLEIDEPQVFTMGVVEDSTDPSLQPSCVGDAPPGAIFSSLLTDEQVIETVS